MNSFKLYQKLKNHINLLFIAFSVICITIAIALSIILFRNEPLLLKPRLNSSAAVNILKEYYEHYSYVGTYIGGVVGTLFSLAGFFLLTLTFYSQNETLKLQKDQFLQQQIESRFFELLNLHKGNVDELVYRDWDNDKVISEGRKVFKNIYLQLKYAIELTTLCVNEVALNNILLGTSFICKHTTDEVKRKEWAICTLAYTITIHGTADEALNGPTEVLLKDFHPEFVKFYIKLCKLIPFDRTIYWNKWQAFTEEPGFITTLQRAFDNQNVDSAFYTQIKKDKEQKNYYNFFGGHQSKLAHYYRHLFRTITYIHNIHDKQITDNMKREYISILQAQLSNYEQFLLLFHSISYAGRDWEFSGEITSSGKGGLITQYNLIKSLPHERYRYHVRNENYDINFQNFFPKLYPHPN